MGGTVDLTVLNLTKVSETIFLVGYNVSIVKMYFMGIGVCRTTENHM